MNTETPALQLETQQQQTLIEMKEKVLKEIATAMSVLDQNLMKLRHPYNSVEITQAMVNFVQLNTWLVRAASIASPKEIQSTNGDSQNKMVQATKPTEFGKNSNGVVANQK